MPGYTLLEELGKGGMGVVYKARQVKLKRLVALKMIRAGQDASAEDLARFQAEAEAVAQLQHPNVVQIYEVGAHNGQPYFSLEFCAGGSLNQKTQDKPQAPREAAGLVETLAQAVEAAHQAGIIHRDLKPANVLLTRDGTPKITDFGLVKQLGSGVERTQSGVILGTPSYMAPEQALGQVRSIGPAADVYALGAILYELLTGRPPFVGDTALNVLFQVTTQPPVPPSHLQPGLPAELEAICLRCLRKKAEERFPTAVALADDLRRFLGKAALAPTNLPPSPPYFTGRADLLAELRQRLRAGGVTILKGEGGIGKTALALVSTHSALASGELPGGLAWINCELQPTREECLRQMAQVFFGDRREQEPIDACARRVRDHLQRGEALVVLDNFESVAKDAGLLRWLAEVRAPARVLVTTREVPAGLVGQVLPIRELPRPEAIELFVQRAAAGGLSASGSEALVNDLCAAVGDQPLALELLATRAARLPLARLLERVRHDLGVLDARSDPTRPSRHQSARACFALSYEQLSAAARDLLERLSVLPGGAGVEVITAVMGTESWDEAAEELEGASLWRLEGDRYTAHALVRQFTLEQLGRRRAEVELQTARAVLQLAQALGKQAAPGASAPAAIVKVLNWLDAERQNLLTCADLAAAAQDWPSVGKLVEVHFNFWDVRGHWADAERLYGLLLTAARQAGDRLGEARSLNHLGVVYRHQGQYANAERALRQSLTLHQEVGDRPGEGYTWSNLSRLYQLQSRYAESEGAAQQALVILRAVSDLLGEEKTLAYLGNVLKFQGRFVEAESAYQQALVLARRLGNRQGEGRALNWLSDIHCKVGRWAEAEAGYQQSLPSAREFGDRSAEARIMNNLGTVYRKQGRWAEAEEAYQKALKIVREVGHRVYEGVVLRDLAQLRAEQGDLVAALELGRQAVAILETTENQWLRTRAEALVAELTRQQENAGPG